MIRNLLFLIASVVILNTTALSQTYTNGVYVKDGKTFEIDKTIHLFAPTNSSDLLYFSDNLIVKVTTNSTFEVNSFFQEVYYTNTPKKSKFGMNSFASTLTDGSVILSFSGHDENSSCIISTPLSDIELNNGLFYIIVNPNRVYAIVIEGSLIAHTLNKQVKIEAGNALSAVLGDGKIFEEKTSLYVDKINTNTFNKIKIESLPVSNLKNSVTFITIDKKVIGVDIN